MKKQTIQNLYNFLTGTIFTFGFFMIVLLILHSISSKTFEIDTTSVLYLFISSAIPWITNFVFGYTSKLYVKGILHGGLWFVLEIIVFNLMFGIAIDAFILLTIVVCFATIYALGLWGFSVISAKLNIPVRYLAEFSLKLLTLMTNNKN